MNLYEDPRDSPEHPDYGKGELAAILKVVGWIAFAAFVVYLLEEGGMKPFTSW